jgi:K+ transporter
MDWSVVLAALRDIVIIVFGIASIVLVVLLIWVVWRVYRLFGTISGKTGDLMVLGQGVIKSAQQTADTAASTATSMKGSAEFVSDTIVSPVVQVVSAVAGARGFVAALFRSSSKRGNGGSK